MRIIDDSKAHLDEVRESYTEHTLFALRIAGGLFVALVLLLLHTAIPAFCKCSASRRIIRLHDEIRARQAAHRFDGEGA